MGFASYIEDMTTRFQALATNAMVGPAQVRNGGSLSPYVQLAGVLNKCRERFLGTYTTDCRMQLVSDLKQVEFQLERFQDSTVMGGQKHAMEFAGDVETAIDSALSRGKEVIKLLERHSEVLNGALIRIQNWEQCKSNPQATPAEEELAEDALLLLKRILPAKNEYNRLVNRCDEMREALAGAAMCYLFEHCLDVVQAKD